MKTDYTKMSDRQMNRLIDQRIQREKAATLRMVQSFGQFDLWVTTPRGQRFLGETFKSRQDAENYVNTKMTGATNTFEIVER